jgi:anti-sigma-K factor RskA
MTQPKAKGGVPAALWIVVALAALATAVVIAALAFASDEVTKPLLISFFGIISTSVPAIIALYKVDNVNKIVEEEDTTSTSHRKGGEEIGRSTV